VRAEPTPKQRQIATAFGLAMTKKCSPAASRSPVIASAARQSTPTPTQSQIATAFGHEMTKKCSPAANPYPAANPSPAVNPSPAASASPVIASAARQSTPALTQRQIATAFGLAMTGKCSLRSERHRRDQPAHRQAKAFAAKLLIVNTR
jgi:hypothetical protein